MRSNKFLWKICLDIYRELFKKAEPSVNFDELIKTDVVEETNWFSNYYLDEVKTAEIIQSHLKLHKCNQLESKKIKATIYLGCSPTCVKKDV